MKLNVARIVTATALLGGLISACGGSPGEAMPATTQTSSKSLSTAALSVSASSTPTTADERITVPSVAGLSGHQAASVIESVGLTITISGDTSNPAYGVLSQTPEAGTKVAKSSVVTVSVGESAKQKEEREAASAAAEASAAQVAADEAARVEAERVAAEQSASSAAAAAAAGSISQQNALRSAQGYLNYTAFSRTGLIDQLEYEEFSTDDATWAVDRVTVDWNEQAAKSAKSYLDYTSFSRSGLVDQLIYEGFTPAEAEYGVSQTGL